MHENEIIESESEKEYATDFGFGHGLSPDYITNAFNAAVQNDINANKQKGLPIAKYDASNHQAYLELSDGTKEYFNE